MKFFHSISLRTRLLGLVILVILPALILTLYWGIKERRHFRSDALDKALILAHNGSSFYRGKIENAHQILVALSQIPEVQKLDKLNCSRICSNLFKKTEGYSCLTIAKPNGQVFAGSHSTFQQDNYSNHPWYKRLVQSHKFTIGEYHLCRIVDKPIITLAYPMLDQEGQLKAILACGLDLNWLNQSLATSLLPPGSSFMMVDRNGTVLLRYPDPGKLTGKDISESLLIQNVLAHKEGVIETTGPLGTPRLFGYTSFIQESEAVHFSVGISKKVAFAEANKIIATKLVVLGIVAILAILAAWFFGRFFILNPVNRLLGKTQLLAKGDLSVRTCASYDQGEIGQLALAFDQMAESLQIREAQQKELQDTLKKNEKHFRSLIENASDLIVVLNPDGTIRYLSPSVERIIGYQPEELIGKPGFDFVHPDNLSGAVNRLAQALEYPDYSYSLEFRCKHKDGSWRFLEGLGKSISDHGEDPRVVINIRDVSERKRAAEELARLNQQSALILCAVAEGILGLDLQGNHTFVNPAAARMLGYEAKELLGRPSHSTWHHTKPDGSPFPIEECKIGATYRDGAVHRASTEVFWQKDGTSFPVEYASTPVYEQGRLAGTVVTFADITEHLQLAEQFQQAQKLEAVGRLTGGIAHDFNNLLTTIIGNADLAIAEVGKESPIYEFLEDIRGAGERAAGLTRQLLAFSRKQILQPEVLNLNEVVGEMDKMLQRVIGEDLELETVLAPDLGRVEADIGQLGQVIMNLAVNARDAMPGGGKLTIETANVELDQEYARTHVAVTPGPYVMLGVSDTGIGMSPEVQAQVFEPFFTTKEKNKGTGLGLSTVYGIVKQSRGNIWVYSEVGRGTSFKIYLPRVDKSGGGEKGKGVRIEARGGTETVLVVEDEDKVRNLAVRVREVLGTRNSEVGSRNGGRNGQG